VCSSLPKLVICLDDQPLGHGQIWVLFQTLPLTFCVTWILSFLTSPCPIRALGTAYEIPLRCEE
jgi:hypothetical protein